MDEGRPEGLNTGCTVCHRALYKKDADDQGRCPDCRPAAPAKPVAPAPPQASDKAAE